MVWFDSNVTVRCRCGVEIQVNKPVPDSINCPSCGFLIDYIKGEEKKNERT